ncbi:MAG: cell division protein FtsQ/DivIB [Hydrogenophaga sp.]|jgi:cell division protein FtsQ|nr:cell division protein FtsQ/DivIB [Hydrogenophaga sp.]
MDRAELPLDIKLMTVATRALVVVFAVLCLAAFSLWAVRHPAWSVRAITVHGDVVHQNAVTFRAQLASQMKSLGGGFLTLDLMQVKQLFEAVPWVRQAVVQREFPNRLRVTIEEHQAVAWWGQSGSGQLVNRLGEVFDASPDDSDNLPELAGPAHQSQQVWALYQTLQAELNRLELGLARLELNARGSWSADLDNGARMELGRGTPEELLARTQRFTSTLSQLTERYPGALQSVDLRYPNGYALRMRGVTTLTEDSPNTAPSAPQNTR